MAENQSKLVWSLAGTPTSLSSYGTTTDGKIVFSKAGYLRTHGIDYYLPLYAKDNAAQLSYSDYETDKATFFVKDGTWMSLPTTAFNDTLYTLTDSASSNGSQIVNAISMATATTQASTSLMNGTLNVSFGDLTSKILTSAVIEEGKINATMNVGQAVLSLQKQIDDINKVNANGMVYQGTTAALPTTNLKEGNTYRVTADITVGTETAHAGDLITYHDNAWVIVPSGADESFASIKVGETTLNALTNASSITFKGDKILNVTVNASNNTVTYEHAKIETVSSNATQEKIGFGDTYNYVSGIVQDVATQLGHVEQYNASTFTIPTLVVNAIASVKGSFADSAESTFEVGNITIGTDDTIKYEVKLPKNPNSVTKLNLGTAASNEVSITTSELSENGKGGETATSGSSVTLKATGALSLTTSDNVITINGTDVSKVTTEAFGYKGSYIDWSVTSSYVTSSGTSSTETITTSADNSFKLTETFNADSNGLHFQWNEIA